MYLWKDFIHLNAKGHKRVAEHVARKINSLGSAGFSVN